MHGVRALWIGLAAVLGLVIARAVNILT